MNSRFDIRRFVQPDAAPISALSRAEGWDYWDDMNAVAAALAAPGVTTLVAERDGYVIGAIQVIGDGGINWVVGAMIVAPNVRRQGVGTALIRAAFEQTGAKRLDVQTEEDGPPFYRRFAGREMTAFRLYPDT